MHRQYKMTKAATRPVLGVVIGLFVFVFGAVASGAAVHHALHHDASSHPTSCAICSFAKSQMDAADASVAVCVPALTAEIASVSSVQVSPEGPAYLSPPGRAPPVLSVAS